MDIRAIINLLENEAWGDGPAGQFIREFNAWEAANISPDLNISSDFEYRGENEVYIDYLFIPVEIRGQGWGKKFMEAICALADKYQIELTLVPMWQDDENEHDENFNLADWYRNFGFLPGNFELVREPE